MALEIIKVNETTKSVELCETIWLNAGRDEALPEGHPDAAFLLGTVGKRIPLEEAERLGLTKGAKTKSIDVTPSTKESTPEDNKESKPEADKDATPEPKAIEKLTVTALDEAYGEVEGYPASANKKAKVAFVKKHVKAQAAAAAEAEGAANGASEGDS